MGTSAYRCCSSSLACRTCVSGYASFDAPLRALVGCGYAATECALRSRFTSGCRPTTCTGTTRVPYTAPYRAPGKIPPIARRLLSMYTLPRPHSFSTTTVVPWHASLSGFTLPSTSAYAARARQSVPTSGGTLAWMHHTRWLPKPNAPRHIGNDWQLVAGSFDVCFKHAAAAGMISASPYTADVSGDGRANWLVGSLVTEPVTLRLRLQGSPRSNVTAVPHVWVGFTDSEGHHAYAFSVTHNFFHPPNADGGAWTLAESWEGQLLILDPFTRSQSPHRSLRKSGPRIQPLFPDDRYQELGFPVHTLNAQDSMPELALDELKNGIKLDWQWVVRHGGHDVFRLSRVGAPSWWKEVQIPPGAQLRPVVHLVKARGWTVAVDIQEAPPNPSPPPPDSDDEMEVQAEEDDSEVEVEVEDED